jgi:hypothetical protein
VSGVGTSSASRVENAPANWRAPARGVGDGWHAFVVDARPRPPSYPGRSSSRVSRKSSDQSSRSQDAALQHEDDSEQSGGGNAATICCAVQTAVGCSVTLKWTTRRRWWASTTSTKRTRKRAVGTVKKSIETRSWTWLVRNVRQVWDGGVPRLGISRETVRSDTSIPSLESSPWILGAPKTFSGSCQAILCCGCRSCCRAIDARWYWSSYEAWRCHMAKMIFSHFAPSARSA